MVVVAALPVEDRLAVKPTRSTTQPLHDPKAGQRPIKPAECLDPEDLTRRLQAHLVQQKLQSERRRVVRAAAVATAENIELYHHVPKAAATAFARTTTPDVVHEIHQSAIPALKKQLEVLGLDDSLTGVPLTRLQRMQALDQAVFERENSRARNQFQWNHAMEDAAEVDVERGVYKPLQRAFEEFAHLRSHRDRGHLASLGTGDIFPGRGTLRSPSTGDIFSVEQDVLTTRKARAKKVLDVSGRNDWAQQEEEGLENKRTVKERVSLFLRKTDSVWILKGKKEKVKVDKNEPVAGERDLDSPSNIKKTRRPAF